MAIERAVRTTPRRSLLIAARRGPRPRRTPGRSALAFEEMLTQPHRLRLYAEEVSHADDQVGDFRRAFAHRPLIGAAFDLDRALD